jgi:hypothetical protein
MVPSRPLFRNADSINSKRFTRCLEKRCGIVGGAVVNLVKIRNGWSKSPVNFVLKGPVPGGDRQKGCVTCAWFQVWGLRETQSESGCGYERRTTLSGGGGWEAEINIYPSLRKHLNI